MADSISTLFDAASATEEVVIELERTMTALYRCHECFSDEHPRDGLKNPKEDGWMALVFTNRAEAYLEMLFVLLEHLNQNITNLDAVAKAIYAAETARRQKDAKEEKP